jgi:hypothetical protein
VIVETGVLGARGPVQEVDLREVIGRFTLRELLAELVGRELAAYGDRRARAAVDTLLDSAALHVGQRAGAIRSGRRALPAAPSPEVAVDRVVEAFGDGLVHAFLDGAPVHHLDAPLEITGTSRLRLLRLVALRGG